jgi:UDP-N-acetylmuramoyl-tripeptide--D-alanyl-D-alanine ligase
MNTLFDLHQTIRGSLSLKGPVHDVRMVPLGRIVTDSRAVEQGDVFWALRGPNHDGAAFAGEAFRRGAAGAVVAGAIDVPEGAWAVQVEDPQRALIDWAVWKRRRFTGTLIGVTGSVGKTTTRQMVHAVLETRLKGSEGPRSADGRLAVPLSMLALEPHHDYAVVELAAGERGEIASLVQWCAPKVGVIMQVADSHLGRFGSRQEIAEAKAELLDALPASGHAVLGEDPWLRGIAGKCAAPITWVGAGADCDLRAVDVTSEHGRLRFRVQSAACDDASLALPQLRSPFPTRFSIPVWGRHHLTAALAAVAVGRLMGFDLEEIAAALEKFQPVPASCEIVEVRGATVISDTCEALPDAMRASLELLRDFDAPGRRIVVCGDLGATGEQLPATYWQIGKQMVHLGQAELVLACGPLARYVTAGARAAGLVRNRAIPCDHIAEALPYLGQAILPGDVVLVKGAEAMGMDRVVEALSRYPQRRSA